MHLPNRACLSMLGINAVSLFWPKNYFNNKLQKTNKPKKNQNIKTNKKTPISSELQQRQYINTCVFEDQKKHTWTEGRCLGTLAITDCTVLPGAN